MKTAIALCLALACPATAMAADPPTALDLDLPSQPVFAGEQSYGSDPPGTYYGDHSGAPASIATEVSGCPVAPDGGERIVTGSVTTGIGYSSRGGNSHFNGANVNVCKDSYDDDGHPRTFNLNIDVQQYDGPGLGGYGGRRGPRGW